MNGPAVRVSRVFDASPGRVFDAWLDASTVGRWLFATPDGSMERVELDPRVGGAFTVVERRGGEAAAHYGVYREIDRPRRLAFSFSVEGPEADGDLVVVEVAPVQEGGSVVTLTHALKPAWAQHAERTREGWSGILDGLARTLGA